MTATVIRNMSKMICTWTPGTGTAVTFNCTAKNLPSFKDAATWTQVSDDPTELTGITTVGKSEGIDAIELTLVFDTSVYESLKDALTAGTVGTIAFTYTDGGTTATISVPKCYICGLTLGGGETNSGPSMTVKFQPTGGADADLPTMA